MPRKSQHPIPKKKFHRGTWELYWNWNFKRYSIYPGRQGEDNPEIETDLCRLALLLADPAPEFPGEWAVMRGVVAYLKDRFAVTPEADPASVVIPPQDVIMEQYKNNLERHCVKNWAVNSLSGVKKLHASVPGGILKTTPQHASQYLESILAEHATGTRNRTLAVCSRFFKWCMECGYLAANPFAGLKNLAEEDVEEITYCTAAERDRIIAIARALGRPDWIAVPIALYAGCRREEVFRLQWPDVNFDNRRLAIRKSKTKKKRNTPIARELLEILTAARAERGPVVPAIEGMTWANQADRLVELIREALCVPENPTFTGSASESVGKRRFLMTEEAILTLPAQRVTLAKKLAKADKEKAPARTLAMELACLEAIPEHARDGGTWIPAERIGWNSWRHTFATLRVQAGVSLDKISAWMGNTPDVCRKHYAEFMPRDNHDEDIDK